MAGPIGNIYKASQALQYHQRTIEVASQNIANVNNPNYAKQRVLAKEGYMIATQPGLEHSAIEDEGLEHLRDKLLDRQIYDQISATSSLEAQIDALSRMEAVLAEEIERASSPQSLESATEEEVKSGTITQSLDNFLNSWHELSADPTNVTAKQTVLTKAETLVATLKNTGEKLTDLNTFITSLTTDASGSADAYLDRIAELNVEIARVEFQTDGQATILRDERVAVLEKLAEIVDIEVTDIADSHGMVSVTAGSTKVALITTAGAKAGTFSALSSSITTQGGAIHGYNSLSTNGTLKTVTDDLTAVTKQLVASVNSAYGAGTFFTATSGSELTTIAIDTSITGATSPAAAIISGNTTTNGAGANDYALAIAALKDTTFSTGSSHAFDGTFIEKISDSVAKLGNDALVVRDALTSSTVVLESLKEQRSQVSGVNLDEEVADLMTYQRAFQATARTINVLDTLLETIVNGLVR